MQAVNTDGLTTGRIRSACECAVRLQPGCNGHIRYMTILDKAGLFARARLLKA